MKRNAKIRLTLNRETLGNLGATELSGAQGGSGICPYTQSCYCTVGCPSDSCPTACRNGCTTTTC